MDDRRSTTEAIAIRDGTIVALGRDKDVKKLAGRGTEMINLRDRRVLPGLIDATLHGIRTGYHCFSRTVALDTTFSRSQALAEFRRVAGQTPSGAWVFTTLGSWQVAQLDVPGMFTKAELDAAVPNHPVRVSASGFSGIQVNTNALQTLDLGPGEPGVVLDAAGQPTGQLTGAANSLAIRTIGAELFDLTFDEQEACTRDFIRELNRRGLTAWDDPGGNNPFSPTGIPDAILRDDHGYQAVNRLHRKGELNARIRFNFSCFGTIIGMPCVKESTTNAISEVGDDNLRIGGVGEEVLALQPDGTYPEAEYMEILRFLAQNEWSFEHHATAGTTQHSMLDMWDEVNQEFPITDLRWRMLHPGDGPAEPNDETLSHLKELGAGIIPTDTLAKGGTGHPPFRRIYESGTEACLGTDALNVSPYPPFVNLWYTVSGKTYVPGQEGVVPEQRLTRLEALRMATERCDWFISLDDKVGTLEVGKLADLIVLNRDYFTVPEDDIRTLTSQLTLVDGEIVFADGEFARLDD
jgi:predicted amidohydrolase YtcJ